MKARQHQQRWLRLAAACERGDAAAVRTLLESTQDPPPPRWDDGKWRPARGDSSPPSMTHLILAVLYGDVEIVRLLINVARPCDLDVACGPDLETAMHVGCSRGSTHLVQLLIGAGANIGVTDAIGRSLLMVSCLASQPDVTSLLLQSSADTEQA